MHVQANLFTYCIRIMWLYCFIIIFSFYLVIYLGFRSNSSHFVKILLIPYFKTSDCTKIVTRFLMMLNIGYWTKFGIILENKIKKLFHRWELKYKSVRESFEGKRVDIRLKLKGMEEIFLGRNSHALFKQRLWSIIPLNWQRKVINFTVT